MTKIMLLGDTHGNTNFVLHTVIPAAKAADVKWIYQVGDFGYWEHTPEGVTYLNKVQDELVRQSLSMLFIAGNHDKTSLIFNRYPEVSGFYPVRTSIWFAPNGTQWEFEGKSFVAFGGAYSVDKEWRLKEERRAADREARNSYYAQGDYPMEYVLQRATIDAAETLWFPEEEMTDVEMDKILGELTGTRIDVMLAHDKPLNSNLPVKLMDIQECIPNQRRLQKAVNTLQPKLFVHGHLHCRYTDTIRCGDDNRFTRVEGLGADVPNFNQSESSWEPQDAWEILDLEG